MHAGTRLDSFTLRRAGQEDLSAVLGVLAEAAEWLYQLGVRQWPRQGFGAERIEPLIEDRVLYVLDGPAARIDRLDRIPAARVGDDAPHSDVDVRGPGVNGGIAAVVALDDNADAEFWTPADEPGAALYVHKLAISRRWAGHGVGDALLDWAGLRVVAAGGRWLRLDCSKDNLRLQDYYRGRRFWHVRTVDLPHRASGALFQRPAGMRGGRPTISIRDLSTHGGRSLLISAKS
ncbi:Acetyltransferase (GNAT) family protein [Sinosporangium album]|uniref:Acetyltransferase (GNAT) family protein n=1 Tax=Sinosporangium album TaxID=504805 RepID=A0A1G7RUD5_9ACTN|nr:GNAT family N-acetyltransferase [Sinosporangium album]SDG14437.1 Acetyltransferase (GNAT) family protein [Sinosporangium album]